MGTGLSPLGPLDPPKRVFIINALIYATRNPEKKFDIFNLFLILYISPFNALSQIARRRRSASGYRPQIATSGPPSVSRWHISVACRRRPTIGWPPSAHHRLATGGPPSAGHCCADNVSHIEKYKK